MNNSIEKLKEELEQRIKSHRPDNPFQPTITHKMQAFPDETVVQYFVDLPDDQREEYNSKYFEGDRNWVEQRGVHYDLTAMLYCTWQV